MDLTLLTMDGQPAPCEFQLVAKDGVYMVQIPRKVDHIVMAAANRWGASSAVDMFGDKFCNYQATADITAMNPPLPRMY